ncbi:MFS transporter [Streptomyces sp. NPDC002817]|uniref:MFS transporter n=1 Tax=Streptomyces sp. NPDC088357 TaxID=3154655 RepID=UPI00341946C7
MKMPTSRPGEFVEPESGLEVPASSAAGSARRYEVRIVVLLAIGFGLVGLDRNIIAPLFPAMVKDLGLNYQDLGVISGVLAICWGLASIFAGNLSDRIGRRKILIPAVVGFSLVCGFTGAASGMGMLLVLRGAMGLFEGAYTPTSIAHTSESSTPSRRGFNMGLQQSLFALFGLGIGPIIATQLLVVVPSWRWVFTLVTLPGFVLAFLLYRTVREPEHTNVASRKRARAEAAETYRGTRPAWRKVFAERNVLLATAMLFGNFSCVFVMITLMPNYLTDHLGLSATDMGLVLSAFGFGGFIGYIALPALSDRLGRKPVLVASFVVGIATLVVFRTLDANLPALYALLFVAAICEFGALCLLAGPVVTEAVPPALVASAAGLPIGIGEITGGGLTPVIGGFMAQHFGIQSIIFVAIVGLAISLTMSLFLRETAPARVRARGDQETARTGVTATTG